MTVWTGCLILRYEPNNLQLQVFTIIWISHVKGRWNKIFSPGFEFAEKSELLPLWAASGIHFQTRKWRRLGFHIRTGFRVWIRGPVSYDEKCSSFWIFDSLNVFALAGKVPHKPWLRLSWVWQPSEYWPPFSSSCRVYQVQEMQTSYWLETFQ
jgi:hypothetical protein